jgi:hypothetical protein
MGFLLALGGIFFDNLHGDDLNGKVFGPNDL